MTRGLTVGMTLRQKTLLIVGILLLAFLAVAYIVSSTLIRKSSAWAEEQEARRSLSGVVGIFSQGIAQLDRRFADWSAWDDTYRFVQDGNRDFIEANLLDETILNLQLNLLLFVDNSGRMVWGTGFDLEKRRRFPLPESIKKHLTLNDALLKRPGLSGTTTTSTTSGIFLLPDAPLFIVARPIVTSKNQGPVKGTLIVGRYFSEAEVELFSRIVRLPVAFVRCDEPKLSDDYQQARTALTASTKGQSALPIKILEGTPQSDAEGIFVQALDEDSLAVYTFLPDIYGKPALIMRVTLPRETYHQSQQNLRMLIASLLLAGLLFAGVTMTLLEKLVLLRWERLSQELERIGQSQDLSARVSVSGSDELSVVSRNTNRMLSALEQAQKELHQSEAQFKAFMDHSPAVAFIKDEAGRYVYVNKGFEEVFQRSESDWKGKTDFDLWPPEMAQAITDVDKSVMAGSTPVNVHESTPSASWLSYKFPIFDSSGKPFLGGISVDITEKEKIEKARRDSERLLQSTLDALTTHIAILDESGKILAVNAAWRKYMKLIGYQGENAGVGQNYLAVRWVSQSKRETELAVAGLRALLSRKLDRFSFDYPTKGLEETNWFHLNATRFSVDGVMRTVITHENITARRTMENSLRESEQRFRQVAENIHEVFWLVDVLNRQLLYVSPAFEEIWGYTLAELYQNPGYWMEAIHPEDRARIEEAARTKQSLNAYDEVFRILRPDGSIRFVHDCAFPIYDESGKVYRVVGVAEDITERTHAQNALQKAHDEMEEGVEKRTAELAAANLALRLAKEEAERANTAKSELLSRVSHELRTPMNAVLGFAELLQHDGLNPTQEESVEEILKAGHHLLTLIDYVLNLTGIEQNAIPVSLEQVDICEVLTVCAAQSSQLASQHQVSVSTKFDTNAVLLVEGNREMLGQVFSILIENAIKYNVQGGQVLIGYEMLDSPDPATPQQVKIEITDTGRGIALENRDLPFLAFERLDAVNLGIEGMGLGLTLAKGLMEAMQGEIGLESATGKGSVFWVKMKLFPSDDQAVLAAATKKPTVLCIEDDAINLNLVERILERREDLSLLKATNGQEGLGLAIREKPALILLDIHLPDGSGEELLEALKSEPTTQKIPIVILSADTSPRRIERMKAVGANDYLIKPIIVQKLLSILQERLPAGPNRNSF